MSYDTNVIDSLDDFLCVVFEMDFVGRDVTEVLKSLWFTIMAADEGGEDCGVVEVVVEVAESFGMHCVDLVVMELHPFQEDGLRD